uniref:ribosomal protein S14 n=1 Tax=Dictyotopsis propagulifera TaxID=670095 RepID=UPI002E77504A|nr:ribosomal protein S14 [Dictyotopsis propagulifera]WBP69971.1 ribosomal protein S14 [Dictyotopsis propagulifera]
MVIHKIDFNRRKKFISCEIKNKILKSILYNQKIKVSIRWWAQLERSKLSNKSSISKVHNFCVQTKRSRSIIHFYKLSRLRLRKLALMGFLPGLQKASW